MLSLLQMLRPIDKIWGLFRGVQLAIMWPFGRDSDSWPRKLQEGHAGHPPMKSTIGTQKGSKDWGRLNAITARRPVIESL